MSRLGCENSRRSRTSWANLDGGILTAKALDVSVSPPAASAPAVGVLDGAALIAVMGTAAVRLYVSGVPQTLKSIIVGRSGTAAAWLAHRARETGRRVPHDPHF